MSDIIITFNYNIRNMFREKTCKKRNDKKIK